MLTYEGFEKELKEALARLYDPEYLPPTTLYLAVGCPVQEGRAAVRSTVLRAIESLKPPADTPHSAQIRLIYDLLYKRFALKLTQEETAYQLHVSRRTVNRLQQSALETLTNLLWERSQLTAPSAPGLTQPMSSSPAQASNWNAQLERELASLTAKTPHVRADVGEVVHDVLGIVHALTPKLTAEVKVMSMQPNLVVTVHPVLLHQILLSVLVHLMRATTADAIALYARLEDGNAKLTLTGRVAAADFSVEALTQDVPSAKELTIETLLEGDRVFIWLTAPSVGKVTVLAVDDNEDMARFYQDCTIGTRYHIVPVTGGNHLFDAIKTHAPNVIVLDIMLPDIDGWRLLMRLHEDPATRDIPVIVCTVIREEALALALGAAGYLAKPVRPTLFIQALDQACHLVATVDSPPLTNNAAVASAKVPLP